MFCGLSPRGWLKLGIALAIWAAAVHFAVSSYALQAILGGWGGAALAMGALADET